MTQPGDHPPLDVAAVRAALAGLPIELRTVERTGSTNADLVAAAALGAPAGSVLVAEFQDSGRGRLDRSWVSPPRAGLTVSVLVRPVGVPQARLGWLSLLAGVSLLEAVRALTPVPAALKWPNDLLLGPRGAKCAGLLAEAAGPEAVVLGIGVNVSTRVDELPPGTPGSSPATSLAAEGAPVTREQLLVELLRRLLDNEADWRAAGGDPDAGRTALRPRYRHGCATLGAAVRVSLPGNRVLAGTATDIDPDGRLVVLDRDGARHPVAVGDVVHVRPVPPVAR